MPDYNNNGRRDLTDSYIDYQAFRSSRRRKASAAQNPGCLTVAVNILFWGLLLLLSCIFGA